MEEFFKYSKKLVLKTFQVIKLNANTILIVSVIMKKIINNLLF